MLRTSSSCLAFPIWLHILDSFSDELPGIFQLSLGPGRWVHSQHSTQLKSTTLPGTQQHSGVTSDSLPAALLTISCQLCLYELTNTFSFIFTLTDFFHVLVILPSLVWDRHLVILFPAFPSSCCCQNIPFNLLFLHKPRLCTAFPLHSPLVPVLLFSLSLKPCFHPFLISFSQFPTLYSNSPNFCIHQIILVHHSASSLRDNKVLYGDFP